MAMTGKALPALSLAGALAALTACSGPAIHFTDFNSTYTHGEVLYATKDGPLPVETFGQVTLEQMLRGQTLDRTVARVLSSRGPQWFAAGFTADRDADPDPYYRLRWLFNPPVNFPWFSACTKDLAAQAGAWGEETGLVIAAFCRGTRFLSAASSASWAKFFCRGATPTWTKTTADCRSAATRLAACRTEVRENGCGRIAMWRGHGIERLS